MFEVIDTKLVWHCAKKEKPKIDKQVLIRIESYYKEDLRGSGFRIGYWEKDPDGSESWFYLYRGKEGPDEMGYIFKAICWSYLPDTCSVDYKDIKNRFEILDL